jgi:hypothetical protein
MVTFNKRGLKESESDRAVTIENLQYSARKTVHHIIIVMVEAGSSILTLELQARKK